MTIQIKILLKLKLGELYFSIVSFHWYYMSYTTFWIRCITFSSWNKMYMWPHHRLSSFYTIINSYVERCPFIITNTPYSPFIGYLKTTCNVSSLLYFLLLLFSFLLVVYVVALRRASLRRSSLVVVEKSWNICGKNVEK